MAFEVDSIDLSMSSLETGLPYTANIYYVDGVTDDNGDLRALSISQLVMAICLSRAAEMEDDIITLMDKMNLTSDALSALTTIEKDIVNTTSGTLNLNSNYVTYNGTSLTYYKFLFGSTSDNGMALSGATDTASSSSSTLITNIESKMDELNSLNQQDMIKLQSMTNKRDQSYDMISNILKSLQTTLVGNVNNF